MVVPISPHSLWQKQGGMAAFHIPDRNKDYLWDTAKPFEEGNNGQVGNWHGMEVENEVMDIKRLRTPRLEEGDREAELLIVCMLL